MSASTITPRQGVVLVFHNGSELSVDRSVLITHSQVLGDILTACCSASNATGRLKVPEERQVLENVITL